MNNTIIHSNYSEQYDHLMATKFGMYDTDFKFICRLFKSIVDFSSKGYYLDGKPLVTMVAAGAYWKYELDSIEETRKALKKYNY